MRNRLLLVLPFLLIVACSKGENEANREQSSKEHIWKHQTEALEQAKQTKQLMQNAIDQQRRVLEDQNK